MHPPVGAANVSLGKWNKNDFCCRQFANEQGRVWLLLYDLHLRHFTRRDPKERAFESEAHREADVGEINECVWADRVHLAASLSRLRIKNGALSLMELLPAHLQDNKVAISTASPIVTGWINPFKLRLANA